MPACRPTQTIDLLYDEGSLADQYWALPLPGPDSLPCSLNCPAVVSEEGKDVMPIDNCRHSFADLAATVLPQYMDELRARMKDPQQMLGFAEDRVGVSTLLKRMHREDDFSGCYVLIDRGTPIYVGISRGVISRLRQHVRGQTHFDASLAYRIACVRHEHNLTRAAAMDLDEFRVQFQLSQEYLRSLQVAFVEIENPLELYVFEAFAALELDTGEWNTFATH